MKRSLIALFLLVTGVVGVGVVAVNVEAHTRTVKISVSKSGFSPSSIKKSVNRERRLPAT